MVVLGCLGTMVEYCQRVTLSVAIVAMTEGSGNGSLVLQDPSPSSAKVSFIKPLSTVHNFSLFSKDRKTVVT